MKPTVSSGGQSAVGQRDSFLHRSGCFQEPCPLCDEAKAALEPYRHRVRLSSRPHAPRAHLTRCVKCVCVCFSSSCRRWTSVFRRTGSGSTDTGTTSPSFIWTDGFWWCTAWTRLCLKGVWMKLSNIWSSDGVPPHFSVSCRFWPHSLRKLNMWLSCSLSLFRSVLQTPTMLCAHGNEWVEGDSARSSLYSAAQ